MLKKTLLTALLALTATGVASANNFYAGFGVGGSALHSENKLTGVSLSGDTGNFGALGSVFGGYNFNLDNQVNLGLEAFANASSVKATVANSTYSLTEKLTYNYGLRLVPGYQITADTDLHLLAGIARGRITFTDSTGGAEGSKNVYGWQGGFGSTTTVNSNFAVRGDIIYTDYKKKTYSLGTESSSFAANTLDGVISGEFKFG